jgi:hypothetical protein
MSYGRNPYYIWSNGEQLSLDGKYVDEKIINAFLYKVLLLNRREELARRLKEGKEVWESKTEIENFTEIFNNMDKMSKEEYIDKMSNAKIIEVKQDKEVIEWMNENEDDILKKLMGGD